MSRVASARRLSQNETAILSDRVVKKSFILRRKTSSSETEEGRQAQQKVR